MRRRVAPIVDKVNEWMARGGGLGASPPATNICGTRRLGGSLAAVLARTDARAMERPE
jgi:hypothetical protein